MSQAVVSLELAREEVSGWLTRLGAVPPVLGDMHYGLAEGIAKAISEGRVAISGDVLTYQATHKMVKEITFGAPTGKALRAASKGESMIDQACYAVEAWTGTIQRHLEELPIREFEEVVALWSLFQLSRSGS